MLKMLCALKLRSSFLLLLSIISIHPMPPGKHNTHTLFQPSSPIQTEIQPHQTSVLMSQGHKGMYFCFSLEPLPPEHLTQFHTSSHQQSQTETQSFCLSQTLQNNFMLDNLPPFIRIQFLHRNHWASIYLKQWRSLFRAYIWGLLAQKHAEPMYSWESLTETDIQLKHWVSQISDTLWFLFYFANAMKTGFLKHFSWCRSIASNKMPYTQNTKQSNKVRLHFAVFMG